MFFKIDAARKVTSVSCDCVYNKSEKCKHVAALINYVNNEESLSKTNYEQEWGKPTKHQFAQEKYSKGKYFYEMFPPPKKPKIDSYSLDISELKESSALRTVMIEASKDKNLHSIRNLMSSILKQVEINLKKEDCKACLNNFFIYTEKYPVYKNAYMLDKELREFYDKHIVMSKNAIVNLSCDTLEQSKCKKWFSARRLRISASKNVHSIKSRIKKSIESVVSDMLYPKKIEIASTQYGINNECNAKEEYKKLCNNQIKHVGVIPSVHQPWLCASLDGVEDDCITKLVEFKCPSTCRTQPVVDFATKKCYVNYLQFRNGAVELKLSHSYYTQCQIQMYISGLNICDLFVYSPVKNGSCLVQVYRNEIFLKDVILKCENFYFKHYLPALHVTINKEKSVTNNSNKENEQHTSFY